VHAGSRAVREFLEAHPPAVFFSGHIHEAEGTQIRLDKTLCFSPGKRGYLLDSDTLKT
jgi:Icc-related predicted phosphoesterase